MNIKIRRKDINTGLPPIIHTDGYVNSVLAVRHPDMYCEDGSNSYLSIWIVVNAAYYNNYPDEYLGWIDLEDLQWNNYK